MGRDQNRRQVARRNGRALKEYFTQKTIIIE
jgi:hypothetical protein